jgi:cyanuric acid amidohydrolase
LLSRKLGQTPEELIKQLLCALSGGTEGVLSPHYVVLSRAGVAATARPDDAPFACAQA